jgi:23S rRNA (cytidine1920-2'-O)/16S rRNA (cytidine1409-2'-O)-methyltransferase
MRADQLLVARALASSRSQAQRLIEGGVRWRVGEVWKTVTKNGDDVPDQAEVQLLDQSEARYASRGGLKLEAALPAGSSISVSGWTCLDVGQSTGGFTDCLLQQGATRVVGVDVGTAQLHPRLRSDPRVLCLEKCNARALDASVLIAASQAATRAHGHFHVQPDVVANAPFEPLFDLIVGDLSFISQTLVLPALVPLLKPGASLLMLVKPSSSCSPVRWARAALCGMRVCTCWWRSVCAMAAPRSVCRWLRGLTRPLWVAMATTDILLVCPPCGRIDAQGLSPS